MNTYTSLIKNKFSFIISDEFFFIFEKKYFKYDNSDFFLDHDLIHAIIHVLWYNADVHVLVKLFLHKLIINK